MAKTKKATKGDGGKDKNVVDKTNKPSKEISNVETAAGKDSKVGKDTTKGKDGGGDKLRKENKKLKAIRDAKDPKESVRKEKKAENGNEKGVIEVKKLLKVVTEIKENDVNDTKQTGKGLTQQGSKEKDIKAGEAAKKSDHSLQEALKWVQRALDVGVQGLREEFMKMRRYVPEAATWEAFKGSFEAGKSRYKDVPCQDNYRIVLKWPGPSDFIHANYLATPNNDKRFICTQGPMPKSVEDFWHMVVQEESESIIMLTNTMEKGFNKCEQYWPNEQGEIVNIGGVIIRNNSVRPLTPNEPTIRLCVLDVAWKEGSQIKTRVIQHYQWLNWPDRGVPPCRLTAMVLLSFARKTSKPIIVHCSAGIGRTGAIVAIEFIMQRLKAGLPCESMDQILKMIRDRRPFSIQNDMQYLYIHRVMLFYFVEKYSICENNDSNMRKYRKFVEEYDRATS